MVTTPEMDILADMEVLRKRLRAGKPLDRSEAARLWAVVNNDIDHLIAYFAYHIVIPSRPSTTETTGTTVTPIAPKHRR